MGRIVEDARMKAAQRTRRRKLQFQLYAVDDNNNTVGHIMVLNERYVRHSQILRISVDENARRKGIGTKLYEAAAALSCRRFKKPLGSDIVRSPMADQFWRKQYIKQRAHCNRWIAKPGHGHAAGSRWCTNYVLSCPAPGSLGRG